MSEDDTSITNVCGAIFFIVAGIYIAVSWSGYSNFPLPLAVGIGIVFPLIGVYFIQRWYRARKVITEAKLKAIRSAEEQGRLNEEQRRHREQFELEQRAKGLEKFVDKKGNERWGTLEQIRAWQREEKELERLDKTTVLREKETIIKEIIRVRCPYCGKLYDETLEICPNCGARR
jgi:hypothetical protein